MKRLPLIEKGSVLGVLAVLLAMPGLASAASKVSVCHTEGNGSYNLIDVSEFAIPAHRRHGDALPGEPVPGEGSMVFGEDCIPEEPTPVVEPGFSSLTQEGSVRLRQQNSGGEVYLGVADLGSGANRVEANRVWSDGNYPVKFSYDGMGTISVNINDGETTLSYAVTPTCNAGAWDTMDVLVTDRSDSTAIAFEDVDLNGYVLGSFGAFDVSGDPGNQNWTITAFDFSSAWMISGNLRIQNFTGSAELNKLQLTVGCLP